MAGLQESELRNMALGLAHSMSRYKLKFSPDKVDTMIVQAICTPSSSIPNTVVVVVVVVANFCFGSVPHVLT